MVQLQDSLVVLVVVAFVVLLFPSWAPVWVNEDLEVHLPRLLARTGLLDLEDGLS